GKNSLNRLIRCVCGKKIGPDPRNFNQRVSLGRNDLLIRTFPNFDSILKSLLFNDIISSSLFFASVIAFDIAVNRDKTIIPIPITDQITQTNVIIYNPLFYY
ncbi:hypothetical protein KVQ99_20520, partial [Escherichia coli]|nr:hypothetical protein [Escherichia coli]